jgi:hypothetical protein
MKKKKLVEERDRPKGYLTLDIIDKVYARLKKTVDLQQEIEDLYFSRKGRSVEMRQKGSSHDHWEVCAFEQLLNSGGEGGPGRKSEIVRDLAIYLAVQFCLNELPRTRGSVARAYHMTKILLERHDGTIMTRRAIGMAYQNAERALDSLPRES